MKEFYLNNNFIISSNRPQLLAFIAEQFIIRAINTIQIIIKRMIKSQIKISFLSLVSDCFFLKNNALKAKSTNNQIQKGIATKNKSLGCLARINRAKSKMKSVKDHIHTKTP